MSNFKSMNLKTKMLVTLIPSIIILIFVILWISKNVTEKSLDNNLESSLNVISHIAAKAIIPGLEFEDEDAVSEALSAFTHEELFSFIRVTDKSGRQVYQYRKTGLPDIKLNRQNGYDNTDEEMFMTNPVELNGERLGQIVVGISLEERDRQLSSAATRMMLTGLLMVGIFILLTLYISKKITVPISNLTRLSERLSEGDIELDIEVNSEDEIGKLSASFKKMVEALQHKTEVAREIARGNLDVEVQISSGKDILGQSMNEMKNRIQALAVDTKLLVQSALAGELKTRADIDSHEGEFRKIVKGINRTLDAVVGPIQKTSEYLQRIAAGDIPEKIQEEYKGDFNLIKINLNTCIDAIESLVADADKLAQAALEGKLETRAELSHHQGDFRKIVEGFNSALNSLLDPINKVIESLLQISQGNLTTRIDEEFHGDHAKMKDAVNQTADKLNEILLQVALAVNQIASGALQVSNSSQAVSEGATTQASSLEETNATMTQIGSQSRQNADNAAQANQSSTEVQNQAETGNQQMNQMLVAMADINDSASQISKIIKVIDEIAFQTNLLALNAAVEAARAGVHGKGFAVVAEEVRNLAQRSAKAAKETTELIENSVEKAEKGKEIADKTANALSEIIAGISRVSSLVDEIANASREQVQGIDQVNSALSQIDDITQSNTASAEESASASEELSSHAAQLKEMLSTFRLREDSGLNDNFGGQDVQWHAVKSERKQQNNSGKNRNGGNGNNNGSKTKPIDPQDLIILDDDEFGDF